MQFERIDIEQHRDKIVKFRKDSFKVSFGGISNLGSEEDYLRWLEEKIADFPEGFVLGSGTGILGISRPR